MKLYVYNTTTNEVVMTVDGDTNSECENKASEYLASDEYAATYSPAFGTVDGLLELNEHK